MVKKVGTHVLIEMYGCDYSLLDDFSFVKKVFNRIIKECEFKCIKKFFHKFNPHGVTAFAVIATSHISFHSWPEFGIGAVDIFTCDKEEKAKKAAKIFLESFKPKSYKLKIFKR